MRESWLIRLWYALCSSAGCAARLASAPRATASVARLASAPRVAVLRRCLKIGEMFGTIVGVECESAVKKFSFQQCEQRVGTNSFAFVQATETISWMCLVRVPKKSDYNQTHIS